MIKTNEDKTFEVKYDVIKKYSPTLAINIADNKVFKLDISSKHWEYFAKYIKLQEDLKEECDVPTLYTNEKSYTDIFKNADEAKLFETMGGTVGTKLDLTTLAAMMNFAAFLKMNKFLNKICLCYTMRITLHAGGDLKKTAATIEELGHLVPDEDEQTNKAPSPAATPTPAAVISASTSSATTAIASATAPRKLNPAAIEESPQMAPRADSTATGSTSALSTGMAKPV